MKNFKTKLAIFILFILSFQLQAEGDEKINRIIFIKPTVSRITQNLISIIFQLGF